MKFKLILLTLIISFCTNTATAQKNKKYIYYLDIDLISTDASKAVIFGEGYYKDGKFELMCYDRYVTTHLFTVHCLDSSLLDLEGLYTSFHLNKKVNQEGNLHNGNKESKWETWDSTGNKVDSIIYKNGYPILKADFGYFKTGLLSFFKLKDSLADTHQFKYFDSSSNLESEIFFRGNKGERKTYSKNEFIRDSLFTVEEVEAEYPGGKNEWSNYIRKNLDPTTPYNNKAPSKIYTVIINFTIDKDGKVIDIISENIQGYGMDEHAIDIIKKGGDWIPGSQFGKKVKSVKRQPISFFVSNE